LWDSEGFEKNVVDLQLREMSSFLESKFEETFTEEMKVVRAPGVQDTHIHCAFLVLDPIRLDQNLAKAAKSTSSYINGGLNGASDGAVKPPVRAVGGLDEDFDLQVLRTLQGKTTVVPVISKADTITTAHMAFLKKQVSDSLKSAKLDPLEALGLDDFDDASSAQDSRTSRILEQDEGEIEAEQSSDSDVLPIQANSQSPTQSPSKRLSSSANSLLRHRRNHSSSSILGADPNATDGGYLPLSIISPDMYDPGVIGRKFPWGFADPLNEEHCDFVKLKESVFSEWRGELREASRELWYEGWRTSRLKLRNGPVGSAR
jgi:septin family protein